MNNYEENPLNYPHPCHMQEDFIPRKELLVNFRDAFLTYGSVITQIKFNSSFSQVPLANIIPLTFDLFSKPPPFSPVPQTRSSLT